MKTNIPYLFLVFVLISSCGEKKKESINEERKIEDTTTRANEANEIEKVEQSIRQELDWDKIPLSNKDLGETPYFTAPEGTYIRGGMETGYTDYKKYDKLEFFLGEGFLEAEGQVVKMYFNAKKNDWSELYFNKSVEQYLTSVGAVKVYDGVLKNDKFRKLQETVPELYKYTFNVGSIIKVFVLKQKNKKILFQVFSNTVWGEVNFVELKDFEQTITKITSEEILNDLEKTGKFLLYVNFDINKSDIKEEDLDTLNEIFELLGNNTNLKIAIEGHTDNNGSKERNKQLSEQRAKSIADFLEQKGISATRLSSFGFGDEKPIVENNSEENKALNRRVELRKVK